MGDILTTSYSLSQYIVTFWGQVAFKQAFISNKFRFGFYWSFMQFAPHNNTQNHRDHHHSWWTSIKPSKAEKSKEWPIVWIKKKTWHPSMILLSTTIKSICNLYLYLSLNLRIEYHTSTGINIRDLTMASLCTVKHQLIFSLFTICFMDIQFLAALSPQSWSFNLEL